MGYLPDSLISISCPVRITSISYGFLCDSLRYHVPSGLPLYRMGSSVTAFDIMFLLSLGLPFPHVSVRIFLLSLWVICDSSSISMSRQDYLLSLWVICDSLSLYHVPPISRITFSSCLCQDFPPITMGYL